MAVEFWVVEAGSDVSVKVAMAGQCVFSGGRRPDACGKFASRAIRPVFTQSHGPPRL
jgi:hypothetical protein